MAKDFVQEHQLSVSVKWNGQTEKLCEHTKICGDGSGRKICFHAAGIIFRGEKSRFLPQHRLQQKGKRLSCLLYEVTVKNTGREAAEMTVCLPALYEKKYSDTRKCVDDNSGRVERIRMFPLHCSQWSRNGFHFCLEIRTGIRI